MQGHFGALQPVTTEYELSDYDANLLTEEKETALYFQQLCNFTSNYKAVANLIINKILPWCKETKLEIEKLPIQYQQLADFIHLIDSEKVSNSNAYQRIFPELLLHPDQSPEALAQQLNLIQSADTDFLSHIIEQVLTQYPDKVTAYRSGKKGLLGFFVGEVMKQSKGKAEPKKTNEVLLERLG